MILRKKLYRDIREQKGTFIALVAIIGAGLCLYVAMFMTMDSLNQAIDNYYRNYRFGDIFATVQNITRGEAEKISLPGIDRVTVRGTKELRVLFPDNDDNVYIRLLSYRPGDGDELNQSHIFDGEAIGRDGGGNQVYLTSGFAAANGLEPGDSFAVLIDGREKTLTVAALAGSPEYVYAVSGPDEVFPNPALFGVAMMPEEDMSRLFGGGLEMNSLSFAITPGYEFEDVEAGLTSLLEGYGLLGLVPRKDQISHFMLMEEVGQLETMGQSIPFLLLFVSFVILIITLRRRVESQRGQIGIMLAFGYHKWEILIHYISYGFLTGVFGGLLGSLSGVVTAHALVGVYQFYFTIPDYNLVMEWRYVLSGMFFAISFSAGACFLGCRRVMDLEPANGMKPPAPVVGKRVIMERAGFFWNMLTISGKMAVRNMFRSPFRSLVSLLGVALVFAMMAVVFSFNNMIDTMVVDQYERVEVYDGKITFTGYLRDKQVKRELEGYRGVARVETMMELGAQLRNGNLIKDAVVIGLEEDGMLYNLYDGKGSYLGLPYGGMVLSEGLAGYLEVAPGDFLYLASALMDEAVPVAVQAVIPQYLGSNAYMRKEELWQVLTAGEVVSAAMVLADEEALADIKESYRYSQAISGISRPDEMFEMFVDYLDTYYIMIYIMGISVSLIGFIIVYNSAVISFSERSRELASLLVLGMHDNEASQVISFEQWLLAAGGMAIGVPAALMMNRLLARSFQNDIYSMPADVSVKTLLLSFVITCCYVAVAQYRINRRMKSLVIVDVLKERE